MPVGEVRRATCERGPFYRYADKNAGKSARATLTVYGLSVTGLSPGPGSGDFVPPWASPSSSAAKSGYA